MLITFKSDAASDVIMFHHHAKELLSIIGKDPEDAKGIVTVEQIPDAIERLRLAIAQDRARQRELEQDPDQEEADREAGRTGIAARVALAQRAWPLLDMLECSQKDRVPVVWGV